MSRGWNRVAVVLAAACLLLSIAAMASASLPDLDIEAADHAAPGTPVPILLEMEHKDSNLYHYVDAVRLYEIKQNGSKRLLKEWKFNSMNYVPQDKWFLVCGEYTFDKNAFLKAEAHCTVHGWGGAGDTIYIH